MADRGAPKVAEEGSLAPVLDRLRALHDALWDPGARLVRLAPGVTPGVDLSSLDLHAVRETALGALLDLDGGHVDRAAAALDAVLALQLDAPGRPWDGTFPVTAEQPDPPGDDAVEWLHYDPNWRQFLGATLAVIVERHGAGLPAALGARLDRAVASCAAGEPEGRIPEWYTNPNLLHAWLQAWVGTRAGDGDLVARGEERARALMARFRRFGDVDEYNSPTYDGVDLVAAGLWRRHPPTAAFAGWGDELLAVVGGRLGRLFHPGLRAVCGPYIRAYGLGLDRYVSLAGLWLAAAGAPAEAVLPAVLDPDADHVHDLYFAPLIAAVAPTVLPHLALAGEPFDEPGEVRRHEQRFGPVEAVSVVGARTALGAERGRHPTFAREQYVPLTVHHLGPDGEIAWLAAGLGEGATHLDAVVVDAARIDAEVRADPGVGAVGVRTLWSHEPAESGGGAELALGGVTLRCAEPPASWAVIPGPSAGWWAVLTWTADAATFTVTVA